MSGKETPTQSELLSEARKFLIGTADALALMQVKSRLTFYLAGSPLEASLGNMKIVTAYLRAECAPKVIRKLYETGMGGLTAYWVHGISGETSTFLHSKRPYELGHLPESLKVEVVCDHEDVERVVGLIAQQATTGSPGDGFIVIQGVERVLRIQDIAISNDE